LKGAREKGPVGQKLGRREAPVVGARRVGFLSQFLPCYFWFCLFCLHIQGLSWFFTAREWLFSSRKI